MSHSTNPCGEITLPGDELVSVKPMGLPLPSGMLFYIDYKYESNKEQLLKAMEDEAEVIELVKKYYNGDISKATKYVIDTYNAEIKTLNYSANNGLFEQMRFSMDDAKSTLEILKVLVNIKMPKV